MPRILETAERAGNEILKTRYYRARKTEAFEAVKGVLADFGYFILGENDTYGEITFRGGKYQGTVTVYSHTPGETSVDMFLECFAFFTTLAGKNKVHLSEFYERLNKKLIFKGLSLNP